MGSSARVSKVKQARTRADASGKSRMAGLETGLLAGLVMDDVHGRVLLEPVGIEVTVVQLVLLDRVVSGILHALHQVLVVDLTVLLEGDRHELSLGVHVYAVPKALLVHALHLGKVLADPDGAGWADQPLDVNEGNLRGFLEHLSSGGKPDLDGSLRLVVVAGLDERSRRENQGESKKDGSKLHINSLVGRRINFNTFGPNLRKYPKRVVGPLGFEPRTKGL